MAKCRYRVTIDPIAEKTRENWGQEYRFSVYLHKEYGDSLGRLAFYKTKQDVLKAFQRIRKEWEGYDAILNRQSDPVTWKNLLFESTAKEITKGDLFGQASLF